VPPADFTALCSAHGVPHEPLCPLGTIVNTHGILGEVRLLPYNPDSDTLQPGQTVVLRWADRAQPARLRSVRTHKRFRLLVVEGVDSATAAETLVGAELCIATAALPAARPGEVYHHSLIGLRVYTLDGRDLGIVDSVMATGSNDVCVVRGESGEHLIPLIEDIVREIDVTGGRLVIDPIAGLLD
jgi:16S rRNA processing protein RimM